MIFSKTFWKDPLNVVHLGTRRMAVTDFQYLRQFLTQGPFCPSVTSTSSPLPPTDTLTVPSGSTYKDLCVWEREICCPLETVNLQGQGHTHFVHWLIANDPPVLEESEMTSPGNFE